MINSSVRFVRYKIRIQPLIGAKTKGEIMSKIPPPFFLLIFIIIIFGACNTIKPVNVMAIGISQEEVNIFRQEYKKIDLDNLTVKQQNYLQEFNQWLICHRLTDSDRQFISLFAWIDIKHLTDRDKIFLMQVAAELGLGLMSTM